MDALWMDALWIVRNGRWMKMSAGLARRMKLQYIFARVYVDMYVRMMNQSEFRPAAGI
jgi:hypothetical protein